MAKKITIIVLSILIVAGSAFGLYVYFSDNTDVDTTDKNIQTATQDKSKETSENETKPTEEQTNEETDEQPNATHAWLTEHVFTLMGVHDNQLNMDVQPRVVFGKGCIPADCYLKFDDEGNFGIFIGGFSGIDAHGTYTVKDDIISVTLSDGSIAEYDIKRNVEGAIDSIVVPINEYSVYFWY